MSLIVEDGTGLSTAQSYVSVADCTAYHANHGNSAWAAALTDALREAALVRATLAIDARGYGNWRGVKYLTTQALDWPRSGAWDADGVPLSGVPAKLIEATCEAALVELGSVGALSKKGEAGLKSITIGDIEKTWTGSSAVASVSYPAIYRPLRRLMNGSAGNIAIGGR
jgi:hypothetical protein